MRELAFGFCFGGAVIALMKSSVGRFIQSFHIVSQEEG